MNFSVLISVYHKESSSYFERALKSIINQTIKPEEIVLVEDGELNEKLYKVIDDFKSEYPKIIKVVKLKENLGLGKALSIGIKNCKYDLVARMDTDDISKPKRFEKQLNIFKENPDIDIVGSWVDEFQGNTNNIVSKRKVPETNKQILRYLKKRNPFNHTTIMYKKRSVIEAGNYKEFYLNEDYYLWIRMLKMGFEAYNIQESLLYFRIDKSTFKRRGGIKYAFQDIKLQNKLLELKIINRLEYLRNIILKPIVRLLPNIIRESIYKYFLR